MSPRRRDRGVLVIAGTLGPLAVVFAWRTCVFNCDSRRYSKADYTWRAIAMFEDEAYPAWLATHPGPCPASFDELRRHAPHDTWTDAWLASFRLTCEPIPQLIVAQLPDVREAFAVLGSGKRRPPWITWRPGRVHVRSAGEDGTFDTADDLVRRDR